MGPTEVLRAVLVGCGNMSAAWLKAARQVDGLEIAGLVDLNRSAAYRRAEEYGLQAAYVGEDLADALDAVVPDMVFDCTVPEAHTGVTLEALRRGCHVLGEKPMADSMENARRLVAAAAEAQRIYAVIQNRRYDGRARRLRSFLASGAIGPLTTLNSDFYIGAHFGGFRDRMEHVLLLDMAIHTFDMARFLTGADPISVYCKEWNPRGSWYDHHAAAVAVFEMTGGTVYTYRGSWCADGFSTAWDSDWRVIGIDGTVLWDGGDAMRAEQLAETGGFRSRCRDAVIPEPELNGKDDGHTGLVREFVECVRTGAAPETVCTDNIKSLAMVFAAVESARSGRTVPVEW